MNKQELIAALSESLSLPQTKCKAFVDVWEMVLLEGLMKDRRIILQGFGTYIYWEQAERMGRNPRTGKACRIAPRVSVKFKPGKQLLEALNKKENDCESTKKE